MSSPILASVSRQLILVKAKLMRQLYNGIKLLKLTPTEPAARLGISLPDVSKLMHGRHTGISIDRLMSLRLIAA